MARAALLDEEERGNIALDSIVPAALTVAQRRQIVGKTPTSRQQEARLQRQFEAKLLSDQLQEPVATVAPVPLAAPLSPAAPIKPVPTTVPVAPALRASSLALPPPLPNDPFRNINVESPVPATVPNVDLTSRAPVFPVEPVLPPAPTPPTSAEILGRQARGAAISGLNTVADVGITKPLGIATGLARTVSGLGNRFVRRPISYARNIARDFVRGATTPLGVTNSQAAQFKTPTKENPVPVTQTSPDTEIDRTETSLASFGLSEDELTRRKKLFAGF